MRGASWAKAAVAAVPPLAAGGSIATLLATGRWSHWGVEAMAPMTPSSTSFADLANITATADCLRIGQALEACDPYGRPFQPYVVLPARVLEVFGLDTAATGPLGIALALCYVAAVAVLAVLLARLWQRGLPQLAAAELLLALAAISPAAMLGVERGQIEQLTLLLVVVSLAALPAAGWRSWAGGVAGLAATVTKYLSIGMYLPTLKPGLRRMPAAWGSLIASALFLLASLPSVVQAAAASRSDVPQTSKSSFGISSMIATALSGDPTNYAPTPSVAEQWGAIRLISLGIFIALVAAALLLLRRAPAPDGLSWMLTVGAGGVLLLPYLLGASHDYRLVFLVALVAGCLIWWNSSGSSMPLVLAGLSIVTLATSASMVPTPQGFIWPSWALVIGDLALMAVLAVILALWLRAIAPWLTTAVQRVRILAARWWVDAAVVLGITTALGLISRRWTGLDTPDSSFYLSLSVFGHDVVDRAPIDSYYATRLGVIEPLRLLTRVFGPWFGYELWRMALLGIIVASAYAVARGRTSRTFAAFLAAAVASSSVLLSYLGNPHPSGTALAGLALLIAIVLPSDHRAARALLAGAVIGWLVTVYPYPAVLGATLWGAIALHQTLRADGRPIGSRLAELAGRVLACALGAVVGLVMIVLLGRALFAGQDWLGTYLEWNAKLNFADFTSTSSTWTTDIALLVPAALLIVVFALWWRSRRLEAAQSSLVIVLTTAGFAFAFAPLMSGMSLEAPMYLVALWPPMLLAFVLAVSALAPADGSRAALPAGIVGAIAIIGAGFVAPGWPYAVGAIVMAVAAAAAILLVPRSQILAIVGIAALLASAQLVQNSRGSLGLYQLSPFHWAYAPNPIEQKVRAAVEGQDWLIANTSSGDRVLVWVDGDWAGGDRDLYAAAAMQLWGENRVAVADTLAPEDLERIQRTMPTAVAFYGPSLARLEVLRSRFPVPLGALDCRTLVWPSGPVNLCLGRVR